MKPFTKAVGGKSWLVEKLVPEILAVEPSLYVEPFLGGGAIALALPEELPKLLGDANPSLIDAWIAIQKHGTLVLKALRRLEAWPESERRFNAVREAFNKMIGVPTVACWPERAAHFLWLNARCFNGLWRTNASGKFNVPWGKYDKPRSLAEVTTYSDFLKSSTIFHADFFDTFERVVSASSGPLCPADIAIFVDSPYHGTFDGYTAERFHDDSQRALASSLDALAGSGSAVWATNADTEMVRKIYDWAQVEAIDEYHSVGAKANRRGKKPVC